MDSIDDLTSMLSRSHFDPKYQEKERYIKKLLKFWDKYGGNAQLFPGGGQIQERDRLFHILMLIIDQDENANFGKTNKQKRRAKSGKRTKSARQSKIKIRGKRRSGRHCNN